MYKFLVVLFIISFIIICFISVMRVAEEIERVGLKSVLTTVWEGEKSAKTDI
jgi:competence protein ComGC